MKGRYRRYALAVAGVVGLAMLAGGEVRAGEGYIQGTKVKTSLPSPFYITTSPDGGTLYVVNQSGHSVSVVNAQTKKVTAEIAVGVQPESAVTTLDGSRLIVCNAESDSVCFIDTSSNKVLTEFPVGDWPCNVKLSKDGKTAYICCSGSLWNAIDIVDVASMSKTGSIATSNYGPRDIAISPDGKTAAVCNDTCGSYNRTVDFIDTSTNQIIETRVIGESSNLREIEYTPDGNYVIVTYETPKNWLPVCEAENGQVFTNNIAVLETKPGGKVARLPLDELNNYDGNPYGLAVCPTGKYLYIGVRGMHRVTILDLPKIIQIVASNTQAELDYLRDDLTFVSEYLVARVPTGLGPSSVCLSPDGKYCYAANYFSNSVSVIRTPLD